MTTWHAPGIPSWSSRCRNRCRSMAILPILPILPAPYLVIMHHRSFVASDFEGASFGDFGFKACQTASCLGQLEMVLCHFRQALFCVLCSVFCVLCVCVFVPRRAARTPRSLARTPRRTPGTDMGSVREPESPWNGARTGLPCRLRRPRQPESIGKQLIARRSKSCHLLDVDQVYVKDFYAKLKEVAKHTSPSNRPLPRLTCGDFSRKHCARYWF